MKKFKSKINFFDILYRFLEIFLLIPVFFSAIVFKVYTKFGGYRFKNLRKFLQLLGIYPIADHYYQPLFRHHKMQKSLREKRNLPGIKINKKMQLSLLSELKYSDEFISELSHQQKINKLAFYFNNGSFEAGDAEFLYQIIRYIKPKNIIEIGSGNSSKVAIMAINKNREENRNKANHLCIEPYEMKWLEKTPVKVLRNIVEDVDLNIFKKLNKNDLLFIDSSHIIRSQGDVLKIYLEILPILKSGVIVHIHDIFTPRDYLDRWVLEDIKLWNEQYLLEALLSNSYRYQILAALNFLKNDYYENLKAVCPFLDRQKEPGSIYIKIK